jgi:beta-lactamase class C
MRLNSMLRTGLFALMAAGCALAQAGQAETDRKVDEAVQAVMREHGIAGMSIAVTRNGTQHFYNYGVASRQTGRPAGSDTLYEIGSISKTYTATLAAYAQVRGRLALSDSPAKYLPELDAIKNQAQLMAYLKAWKPEHAAGTYRTYANPSIGMLGMVAAKSLNRPFKAAMERDLFPKLGLTSTYIDVPAARMADYAQGYNKQDAPVRVNPGVLADEAYGVKTSARDLIRFVDANMGLNLADAELRGAIAQTHVGYYQLGDMTQDLAWEQLRYPATLDALLTANAGNYNSQSQPVAALNPPLPPQEAVWINKTGSTNGFGGYVAFVPSKKLGIVILANRNYPNEARVRLAYRILGELEQ